MSSRTHRGAVVDTGDKNSVPVADAGADQNVTTGGEVTLDGSGSSDADGDPLAYSWAFTSKPAGSAAALSDPAGSGPTFAADLAGTYKLSLTVNDGTVNSQADSVTITAANATPAASATKISVTLDNTSSASQDIDATNGGTLTASAADGTTYSLSIPPNALRSPETITLTPVSGITGLPLSGGLTAAVDIQPNGLHLVEPATLTITPAAGVPVPDSIAFGYQDDEFYLYPVSAIDSTSVTLKLMHFSGYGSGTGTASDTAAQQDHPPSSPENKYQQEQSGVDTAAAKRASESGTEVTYTDEELDQLGQIYQDWYNDSIKPNLTSAAQTNEELDKKIREYLTWWAEIQLHDLEPWFQDQIEEGRNLIGKALPDAIDMDYARCKEDHDPGQVPWMLHWLADGIEIAGWNPETSSSATFDKVRKCATFQLDFLSQITWETGNFTTSSTVEAQVTLTYDEGMEKFTGSDTFLYPTFDFDYTDSSPQADCQITSTDHPDGTLSVPEVLLNLKYQDNHPVGDVTMTLEPSILTETVDMTCPDPDLGPVPGQLTDEEYWYTGFFGVRNGAGDWVQPNSYVIQNWTVTGGETWATKDLSGTWSVQGVMVTESGRLKLIHTPR